jgi:chemotaxis family two-component system response regulator Rcp1
MRTGQPVRILLVEDNPGDVRLTKEAFREGKVNNEMYVVSDGVEALEFLRRENGYADRPHPDIVLLDLNLPRKDGREVLAELKQDAELRHIPVIVLTTSEAEGDVRESYDLHANCYIKKPVDISRFIDVLRALDEFWFSIVRLPGDGR